jgi:hypothetical protein
MGILCVVNEQLYLPQEEGAVNMQEQRRDTCILHLPAHNLWLRLDAFERSPGEYELMTDLSIFSNSTGLPGFSTTSATSPQQCGLFASSKARCHLSLKSIKEEAVV